MLFSLRQGAIALALCCCSLMVSAQYDLPADKLARIPVAQLPTQDNTTLLATELAARKPGRADQFAVPIRTKIRPSTHGTWSEEGNESIWRMRISSPGAHTLNFGFSEYHLPIGAELSLFSASEQLGPYSAMDNEVHHEMWTPVIEGDEVLLELKVPTAVKEKIQLYLTFIHHDFMNVNKTLSGSCNVDVNCGAADGFAIVDKYRDIIRSVARITIGGGLCTGFLVNNVNEDGRPLFMTANHCGIGPANAAQVIAYWNFENSTCRAPFSSASGRDGDGNQRRINSGTVHLASYSPSDVTLLEFDDPINPAANVFFAGWSAEEAVPQDTLICIHHPAGDEKRISFSYQDAILTAYRAQPTGDNHLEVPFWNVGTTEGGSSGAPLFDRFKRVRGQLHGGAASCNLPNEWDSYGFFAVSWEGGGTVSSRIRDYLDPCNTGTLSVDGFEYSKIPTILTSTTNCFTTCPTEQNVRLPFVLGDGFAEETTITVANSTPGITPELSTSSARGGETVELIIPVSSATPVSTYTIDVLAAGPDGEDVITFNLRLEGTSPAAPALLSPAPGETEVLPEASFTWVPEADAGSYEFQLSLTNDFSSFLAATSTNLTTIVPANLLSLNQTHYWRVRSVNRCGAGDWVMGTFTTADINCGRFVGSNLPATISQNGTPEVEVEIELNHSFTIGEFEVALDVDHSYLGDLSARLRAPSGTEIQLFNAIDRCAESNMSVVFADAASMTAANFENTCTSAAISTEGTFQPAEPFSTFLGENSVGTWTLILNDGADADGGAITGFSILFCGEGSTQDLSVSASQSALVVCRESSASIALSLGADYGGDVGAEVAIGDDLLANYSDTYDAANGTLTIDFTGWGDLPDGTYELSLTAINGNGAERAITIPLQLASGIAEVLLAGPADEVTLQDGPLTFSWEAITEATSYTWQYATTEDFAVVAGEQNSLTNEVTITDLPTGNVFWRVIAQGDCGTTMSAVRSLVIAPSAVHDFGDNRTLNVYPNPVQGRLTVEATGSWPNGVQATLFDAAGRRMADYQMATAGRAYWDMGTIPAGVYYLRFTSLGTQRTDRLVVLP